MTFASLANLPSDRDRNEHLRDWDVTVHVRPTAFATVRRFSAVVRPYAAPKNGVTRKSLGILLNAHR